MMMMIMTREPGTHHDVPYWVAWYSYVVLAPGATGHSVTPLTPSARLL